MPTQNQHHTPLAAIELDASIQCRAGIDTALVNEYAERMEAGDKFPAVILFGKSDRSWIGDGWHRVMAAKQVGKREIDADLRDGGRVEALKHALGANVAHGHRRSNADKRRCVEIALREFKNLSSRAIAELCGVGDQLVRALKGEEVQVRDSRTSKITGKDGKHYPATRAATSGLDVKFSGREKHSPPAPIPKLGPPCDGMQFARLAILQLKQIRSDDTERQQAFNHVKGWIDEQP